MPIRVFPSSGRWSPLGRAVGLSPRRAGRRRANDRRRPTIENLEVRSLLSTMFVDDDWAGLSAGTVVDGKTIGTDAFATIQGAISMAVNGDEVRIAEGTYSGVVTISKSLDLVGAGADKVTLDVSAIASSYGVNITASEVGLSGMTVKGSKENAKLKYGIYSSGKSDVTLQNLVVHSMPSTGVNLIGSTDFTITGVTSRDNNGAGIFLTDVKRGTLTDVATSGNVWTGLAFSTAGRYHAIGIEGVVIAGASTFGEAATANGGVMFEESSWDDVGKVYDPSNPYPITFSTNPADGADVTFSTTTPLPYVLSGPQDDAWSVRRRFYASLDQGLDAASGAPDHYLNHDRVLATVGASGAARTFTVGPYATMSIQAAIDAADVGDTVHVQTGTYAENLAIDQAITLEGADGAILQPTSGAAVAITGIGSEASPIAVRGFQILGGEQGVRLHGEVGGVVLEDVLISGTTIGVDASDGAAVSGFQLRSSVITGNGTGLLIGEGAEEISINFSRIVGNASSALTNLSATAVDAVHNWWGSNAGPGSSATGAVTAAPYIVLSLSNPGPLVVGGSAGITVDLNHDSAGQDVSGLGRIPGLSLVHLTPDLGSLSEDLLALVDGVGSTLFSAGRTTGQATVTASLDGASASTSFDVLSPPLSLAGPASVDQGSTYTLSLLSDGSPVDVGLWRIDWGDGTIDFVSGGLATASHVYSGVPGARTISATATTTSGVFDARNTVSVRVLNVAPTVAIVGAPGSLNQGESVVAQAVGADLGGDALTYAWTVTREGVVVFTGDQATLAFAPVVPGEYVVSVTASDPHGASGHASQAVSVLNVAPTVVIPPIPEQIDAAATVSLTAQAADVNPSAVLTYAWTVLRNGTVVAVGDRAVLDFTPIFPGVYEAVVEVSDGEGGLVGRSVVFTAVTANAPPAVQQSVQDLVTRTDAVVREQEVRLAALTAQYGEAPPPTIRRLMQRIIQSTVRIQAMTNRRIFAIQRTFSRMARR
ncbi:right-handed parallel beta-helix repeat-containing protein [Planctomyces sp. SH-PL62]|uniref:right-handed parallel beta-helix repeat-containing protein n=1 Tax=Planctomyces sp. SH-PL62 TaxID=1636152 RepID=UPI00078EC800|nr:right-handed parallel beta-helix repeat-containing protein [Planctomyces sp. SH-PL62]AMV35947.1 hypothetical protein VT85_00785 [Planctomyces sp. SH-PL62]